MIDKQNTAENPDPKSSVNLKDVKCLEHVVCIMFENRSFDNMMGYLYGPDKSGIPAGQNFEGLTNEPGTYWCLTGLGEKLQAFPYVKFDDPDLNGEGLAKAANSPYPDPGEEYQQVNVQLYGTYHPWLNYGEDVPHMVAPYNMPDKVSENDWARMRGFFKNYFYHIMYSPEYKNKPGSRTEVAKEVEELSRQIMGSFTPRQLPVLSKLAEQFAVYDHWFSAVPTQTFPNRAFFHASTSSGYVTNWGNNNPENPELDPEKWLLRNRVLTIFNSLEKACIPWAIYYDESQRHSMTTLINAWAFEPEQMAAHADKIRTMDQFYKDVENGNLPAYSFIEPRGFFDHNDMHPPLKFYADGRPIFDPSDVRAGEQLLHEVYTAIRNSKTEQPGKSNAMNTTLLITFDEHGGTYDHVMPPAAKPPHPDAKPGECDFKFDRFGLRVPTIVVSAQTRRNTVINDFMHHGSLIATLCNKYGLDPLTERDKGAPDIGNAFNLPEEQRREANDWPETVPNPVTPKQTQGPFTGDIALTPLTTPALSQAALLLAKYGEPGDKIPENYQEAYEMFERIDKKLPR